MKLKIFLGGLLLLVVTLVCWYLFSNPSASTNSSVNKDSSLLGWFISGPKVEPKPIEVHLDSVCLALRAAKDAATMRSLLSALRTQLESLPPEDASKLIQAFLASHMDALTHLNFSVKRGGGLGDASSLRIFLLDYLGLVDRDAAAKMATEILANPTDPDEWAVCLRNYAWAHPDVAGQSYLKDKIAQLLANTGWANAPTAGFLEAFDTVVYTGDTDATPVLTHMMQERNNPVLVHAAYLTLDRLVINQPLPMLQTLVDQPDLMQGREQTRANFVARADLSQPDQAKLVEQYLLNPNIDPRELATFSGLFPNANYMISDNLLTPNNLPNAAIQAQRDQADLAVIESWQNDSRFIKLQPFLNQIHQRLTTFVQQEAANH